MTKIIHITFPNGDTFTVPAEVVAKHRTEYYKSKDEEDFDYDSEFESSMEDDELYDWLGNNMDWADVKEHATKIQKPPVDYDTEWTRTEFEIKEA